MIRKAREIVEQILRARGILEESEIEEFLSDRPKLTYNPFLLPDMEEGADFLISALASGKNICVYGDYDVDGLTSTVLMVNFLRELSKSQGYKKSAITWHIPSRFDEGYGLNTEAIDSIYTSGTEFIITVDCGSVSALEVEYAQSLGIDVLVTDHHDCNEEHMPFCPVINPKREDSKYQWRGLSGCGVVFKLTQAIKNKYFANDPYVKALVNEALDLVAIATVADVMPLLDENRTLVKYGLDLIRKGKRVALVLLCEQIGLKIEDIRAYNIGFGIAPHINAAGRMDLAAPVVDLFLTDNHEKMVEIISELIRLNQERRKIQEEAIERCKELVDEIYLNDLFLLVKDERMHEGISGIVAGKLRETFNRPAAVLSKTEFDGKAVLKGSARSMDGVDIISLLQGHAELFLKLGGHAMAAGFTLEVDNEEALRAALNVDMNEVLKDNPELFDRKIHPEIELEIDEVDVELAEIFGEFEPCGMDNPRPVIAVLGGETVNYVKRVGFDKKHLSFKVGSLSCIWFGAPDDAELKLNSNPEYFYGTLNVNEWNGYRNPQLNVSSIS